MKRWARGLVLVAVMACGGLAPELVAQDLSSARVEFAAAAESVELPFELYHGLPVVDVQLVGREEPLRLILDSGAAVMVLTDGALVDELGWPVLAQANVQGHGDGQAQTAPLVGGVALRLGEVLVSEAFAVVGVLGDVIPGVDGVLGRAVFTDLVVDIDWAGQRLVLHPAESFAYPGHGTILPITVDSERGAYAVPACAVVDGGAESCFELVLDTGARQAVGFRESARGRPARPATGLDDIIVGWGSQGPARGFVGRLEELRFEDIALERAVAGFVASDTSSFADGWLGVPVLQRFRTIFDLPNRRLILEPNERLREPFEFDTTGLQVAPPGPGAQHLEVAHVIPGSAAARAGVEVGDRIVAIDDQAVADLDLGALRAGPLVPRSGVEIRLRLLRRGEEIERSLQTERLI